MSQFQWLDDDQHTQDRMLEGMAEPIQDLFEHVRALDVGLPLLAFLAAHTRSMETSDDIAYHLSESPGVVAQDLQSLIALGLARQVNVLDLAFFSIIVDPEQGRRISELIAWQALWTTRQARIGRVINRPALTMGKSPNFDSSDKASPTATPRLW